MEPSHLDGAAKAFAQTSTRGQALRALAGGMFGAALLFGRPGRALAGASDSRDDHGDKDKSKKCSRNTDCPSGQVCLDGACFSGTCSTCGTVNTPCATNVDCCNGLICVNGACFSGTCTSSGGCTSASTCPQAAAGSCHTATCVSGVCGFSNNVAGSACTGGTCDGAGTCVAAQCTTASQCPQAPAGSCKVATCTGGICGFANDSTNLPTGCGPCTNASCLNGVPVCIDSATGTTCNSGGGSVCNGAGQCVQCVTPSNCPGTDTICATRTCGANGTCGMQFASNGTVCTTDGLHHCDGAGNCV